MEGSSTALRRVTRAVASLLAAGLIAATASVAGATLGGDDDARRASPGSLTAASVPTPAAPSLVVTSPPAPSPPPTSAPAATAPAAPRPAAARPRPAEPAAGTGVKQPPPRPNRASEAPSQGPASSAATATPGAPATTARHGEDFPDPFVFRAGAWWYAVSTQRGWSKVPMLRSPDLLHWEERGDALAALPRWSRFGALWAPSVLAVEGGFVLFYTTTEDATGLQCVSSAFSVLPDGPFVDASTGPLVCQRDRGGSIDPSPFRDASGRPWLAWKSEGTTEGEPTRLWSQRLADDGRSLAGEGASASPAELLATALPWEGPIVEAPSMFVADDGTYHLLYSGNRWETSAYAIGHARCAGPAGPCTRSSDGPVVARHASEAGAGGAEVFRDPADGRLKAAYHAWDPAAVGYPGGLRRLRIGAVRLGEDGAMRVEPLPR